MIRNLHTYYEEDTDLYVVAFTFKEDSAWSVGSSNSNTCVRYLERWCYDHYGIGFRSYVNRPTTSKSLTLSRWCMDDIPWGELRFKQESDATHFVLFWALSDETEEAF